MADTTVTIRVDEEVKHMFERFCADVGLNMSVAVNMFIRATLRQKRIPFQIETSSPVIRQRANIKEIIQKGRENGHVLDVAEAFRKYPADNEFHGGKLEYFIENSDYSVTDEETE